MVKKSITREVKIISIQELCNVIHQQYALHKELYNISSLKTESIKNGDMEHLSKLLIQEKKQVHVIEQLEKRREQLVDDLFEGFSIKEQDRTVSRLLPHIDDQTAVNDLEKVTELLYSMIIKIKENESLNNELLHQSMQFVQFSLDMFQPLSKNITYGDRKQEELQTNERSVFDSKA